MRESEFYPDLNFYDVIAVSTSGGKDSQTQLRKVCQMAQAAGVHDRVVAIHSDLGERVEWPDVQDFVRAQCEAQGVPLIITSRLGQIAKVDSKVYRKGEVFGDLIDYSERRGAWPSSAVRFCTSEFKRGPINRVYTALAADWKKRTGKYRQARILDCMGIRGQESVTRANRPEFEKRTDTANQRVDSWLPIKHWLNEEVWQDIYDSRVPYHWAYDRGMRRLSCVFCVFGQISDLIAAGKQLPKHLQEWVEAERRMGFTFQQKISLAEVQEAIRTGLADQISLVSGHKHCDDVGAPCFRIAVIVPGGDSVAAPSGTAPITAEDVKKGGTHLLSRLKDLQASYQRMPATLASNPDAQPLIDGLLAFREAGVGNVELYMLTPAVGYVAETGGVPPCDIDLAKGAGSWQDLRLRILEWSQRLGYPEALRDIVNGSEYEAAPDLVLVVLPGDGSWTALSGVTSLKDPATTVWAIGEAGVPWLQISPYEPAYVGYRAVNHGHTPWAVVGRILEVIAAYPETIGAFLDPRFDPTTLL